MQAGVHNRRGMSKAESATFSCCVDADNGVVTLVDDGQEWTFDVTSASVFTVGLPHTIGCCSVEMELSVRRVYETVHGFVQLQGDKGHILMLNPQWKAVVPCLRTLGWSQ